MVNCLIDKQIGLLPPKRLKLAQIYVCFLGSQRFCHLPKAESLDCQWLPGDLQEVALPTPAIHCFQIAAS